MKNKTIWYEVYQYGNELTDGTQTIAIFDTIEEAKAFTENKSNVFIDRWEMAEGEIPKRIL